MCFIGIWGKEAAQRLHVWTPVALRRQCPDGSLDDSLSWEVWPCHVIQAKQHAKCTGRRENNPPHQPSHNVLSASSFLNIAPNSDAKHLLLLSLTFLPVNIPPNQLMFLSSSNCHQCFVAPLIQWHLRLLYITVTQLLSFPTLSTPPTLLF